MGVAPLLQLKRMLSHRSAPDVSVAYLLVLIPGFVLWLAYRVASADVELLVPHCVALVVAPLTASVAIRLKGLDHRESGGSGMA